MYVSCYKNEKIFMPTLEIRQMKILYYLLTYRMK